MTEFTKKDAEWHRTQAQEQAFNKLKGVLAKKPVLKNFRQNIETELHTDASQLGLAGILLQNEDKQRAPAAYYSRQTRKHEKIYHSYELEMSAVVERVKHFHYYLSGRPFRI